MPEKGTEWEVKQLHCGIGVSGLFVFFDMWREEQIHIPPHSQSLVKVTQLCYEAKNHGLEHPAGFNTYICPSVTKKLKVAMRVSLLQKQ